MASSALSAKECPSGSSSRVGTVLSRDGCLLPVELDLTSFQLALQLLLGAASRTLGGAVGAPCMVWAGCAEKIREDIDMAMLNKNW